MIERKFRIGIVGAGQIVENAHLPTICSRRDVDVAWVADVKSARSGFLSGMYGVPAASLQDLNSRLGDIDACLIATPIGVREPYIDACRTANVALYIEKPFARGITEHDRFCSGFSPERIAVGYQRRAYRSLNLLRQAIRSGLFGVPISLSCSIGGYSLKSGGATFLSNADLAGGGVLIELGIHVLDQIIYLLSPSSIEVQETKAFVDRRQDYDLSMRSTLNCPFGPLLVSGEFSRLRPLPNEFVLEFGEVWLRVGVAPNSPISVRSKRNGHLYVLESNDLLPTHQNAVSSQQAFSAVWDEFLAGLSSRSTNISSAASSRMTTLWLEQI